MRKRTVHTKIKVKRRKSKEEYVSFTKFLKIVSKRKQSVFTAPPPEKPEPVRKGKYVSFKELVTKIKKNKIAKERWGRKLRRPVKNVVKKKKVKKLGSAVDREDNATSIFHTAEYQARYHTNPLILIPCCREVR